MIRTFYWEVDAGHSWLLADFSEITALGITSQISEFSYLGDLGQIAYLEEDVDAPLFLDAIKLAYYRKWGNKLAIRCRDLGTFKNVSPIRKLKRFPQTEAIAQ